MRHGSSSIAAHVAALALLTGLGFASAARAAVSPFPSCDGYGPPLGHADGMTAEQAAKWLPIQSEGADPDRKVEFGDVGVDACDAALADPALKPAFWARRVNLLRARALHNIAAGHYDEALKDLDRAKAEIKDPTDPFFRRSVGLSLDFLRAYADHKVGRSQEGVDHGAQGLGGATVPWPGGHTVSDCRDRTDRDPTRDRKADAAMDGAAAQGNHAADG